MAHNKIVLVPTGEVLIDLTQDDVTEADVVKGKTFHKADGTIAEGAYEPTVIEPETEAVTVELSMADGDQVIEASEDKLLSKVTVTKPSTMLPENIKEGVEIGGVVGTHVGGMTPEGESKLGQIMNKTVTEITEADLAGATQIGEYAFINCVNLGNVRLPSSVTTIQGRAFYGCKKLTGIDLSKVITIYDYAFQNLGNSTTGDIPIVIPSNVAQINQYAFAYSRVTSVVLKKSNKSIADMKNAFYQCTSLRKVVFESRDFSSGSSMFGYCSALNEITLENGLTQIPSSFLANCTSLTNISIPSSVGTIGSSAFNNCTHLKDIDMTSYGRYTVLPTISANSVFSNCGTASEDGTFKIQVPTGRKAQLIAMTNWSALADNIVEVGELPDTTDIPGTEGLVYELSSGKNSYICTGIGTATDTDLVIATTIDNIPVAEIKSYAFQSKNKFTSIVVSQSVVKVGHYGFSNNQSVTSVSILGPLKTLENYTFSQLINMTSLELAEGIKLIGQNMFSHCEKLPSVKIPSTVAKIDTGAFAYCYKLEYIDLTSFGTNIEFPTLSSTSVFSACGSETESKTFEIRVPMGRKAELADMTYWSSFSNNIVEVS